MVIMMLLPIIIIVVLIFVLFNHSGRGNNTIFKGDSNNALDILDKRFANGEISEEEYLKRRSVLRDR
jgi:putative membrane protein